MPPVCITLRRVTLIRTGLMIMAFKAAVAGGTIAFRLAATLECAVT